MFTGIVDHYGWVREVSRRESSVELTIETTFSELVPGESIAVDGTCLTVTTLWEKGFRCEVSPETLKLTTLDERTAGSPVNLERAMRLSDRIGGHLVTGHVDRKAKVTARKEHAEFVELTVGGLPSEAMRFLIPKGSVAVNGVSLTVNRVTDDGFEVMIIPHTLERTTLSKLKEGDGVNIELDWMTKVILHDASRVKGMIA